MRTVEIKKVPKITIVLYICGALMTLCAMFMIYRSNTYISGLVAQGFDASKERGEVINYYLATVTPYIFYTIALFSLGYIVQRICYLIKGQETRIETMDCVEVKTKNEDDEIDEFFDNI
ncbi:MAG: hypothetical protein ACRDA3_02945 [Peptostreptococcaceae bacterium]